MTEKEYRGETLAQALAAAEADLEASFDEIRYEVVADEPGSVVVVADVDPEAVIGLFVARVLEAAELDVQARISGDGEVVRAELQGPDLGLLTERGGGALDALQYLCSRVLGRRLREPMSVRVDGGGFKGDRAERLRSKARKAAAEAVEQRRQVWLEPMTPAARREVHLALADDARVETESDGDGFIKRVVVSPARGR